MSFLSRLLGGPVAASDPLSGTANPEQWFVNIVGGVMTSSGLRINVREARQVPGISACIKVLSDDGAKVPLNFYRRKFRGGKELATDHPYFKMVKIGPAPWLSSYAWRRAIFDAALTYGNGYSLIERMNGIARRMTLLKAGTVSVRWADDGEPFFDVTGTARSYRGLSYSDVLHVPYQGTTELGENGGIFGVSPIARHPETIGLAIAAERFAAAFFRNGARPSLALETDKIIDDPAIRERIREGVQRAYSGTDNAFRVAVLELGLKIKELSFNNEESQLVEVRKEQALQMCQIYNVPPHKIGILDRATFSNIEHQSIDYVTGPLSSLVKCFESALNTALLTDAEREEYFFEFNLDGLLRGDLLSRYRAYAIGRQWGWLNADEIRERENMNEIEDGSGRTYYTPLNMTPSDKAAEGQDDEDDGSK